MDFSKLKERMRAESLRKEKVAEKWSFEYENAKRIADKLITICMRNKKDLSEVGVDTHVSGEAPNVKINFRNQKVWRNIEVRIVCVDDTFYLNSELNDRQLSSFNLPLSAETTYEELEQFIEKLINENI